MFVHTSGIVSQMVEVVSVTGAAVGLGTHVQTSHPLTTDWLNVDMLGSQSRSTFAHCTTNINLKTSHPLTFVWFTVWVSGVHCNCIVRHCNIISDVFFFKEIKIYDSL